jgi:hypothetical protein
MSNLRSSTESLEFPEQDGVITNANILRKACITNYGDGRTAIFALAVSITLVPTLYTLSTQYSTSSKYLGNRRCSRQPRFRR